LGCGKNLGVWEGLGNERCKINRERRNGGAALSRALMVLISVYNAAAVRSKIVAKTKWQGGSRLGHRRTSGSLSAFRNQLERGETKRHGRQSGTSLNKSDKDEQKSLNVRSRQQVARLDQGSCRKGVKYKDRNSIPSNRCSQRGPWGRQKSQKLVKCNFRSITRKKVAKPPSGGRVTETGGARKNRTASGA